MDRQQFKVDGAAPAIITDHPFRPKSQWWSLCAICNLAQSAHAASEPYQGGPTTHRAEPEEERGG